MAALILDPFGGAGTTLVAAERTGRRARVIELNPIFVDISIERWQRLTGGTAFNADTGEPFVHSAVPAAATGGSASVARQASSDDGHRPNHLGYALSKGRDHASRHPRRLRIHET